MNILELGQPPKRVANKVPDSSLLTTRAASQKIGIGEFAVRSLVRKGKLPARRVLGRLMIDKQSVTAYAKERVKRTSLFEKKPTPDGKIPTANAARILGVCEETLRRAHRKGILHAKKYGSVLLFNLDDVERAKAEGLSKE